MENISVVIPFKRGGNETWLKEALHSLPRGVKHVVAENDGELHEALNAAIEAADTEFVMRLDADDVLHRDCLEFLVDLAWDCDVTYPSLVLCGPDLQPLEEQKAQAFCPNRLQTWNYISGCAFMRRDAVLEVGGYRELPLLEDWDLYVRMMRAGKRFKAVPEARYLYRQHNDSRNRNYLGKSPDEFRSHMRERIVGDDPEMNATFYAGGGSLPQTYYRCLLPSRELPAQTTVLPEVRMVGDDSLEFPFHRGDAAIWQYPGDATRALFMSEMQEQGLRVLVEVDDTFLTPSPLGNPGWIEHIPGEGELAESSLEAHRRLLPWVDGIIVTTEELGKRYRKYNPNVYVCPNQIDPLDWPQAEKPDDGIFRIGWFGSASHVGDSKPVLRALEWASQQPNVEVVTMGVGYTLKRLVDQNGNHVRDKNAPWWNFPFRMFPWSNDLGVYRKLLGTLDVGLAPIVETPWSVCRSDLKALEYAMAEVCPVLSDTIPYKPYQGPGFKARTSKDFLHVVKHLVKNQDEALQVALEAKNYVLRERTVERNVWRWEQAISDRTRRAVA